MKRNHTNHRAPRGGTSPYARYRKSPYRYSDLYQEWFKAAKGSSSNPDAARRLAREHFDKFGPRGSAFAVEEVSA